MPPGRPRVRGKLTDHLRKVLEKAHEELVDGEFVSKGEALAALLVRKALGHTSVQRDDNGNEVEVVHKPESWAITYVFDRIEGKVPQPPDETKLQSALAKDKVSELARERASALAKKIVSGSAPSGPPPLKPKK